MSRNGLIRMLFVCAIEMAVVVGCGGGQPAAEESIKIGMIAPLTGAQQFEGQLESNGVKMAVDEINKAGGLLGRPVTLIIEDDQAQAAVAVSAVEKLITKDKIVALQGAQWSSQTKALMPVLEKYGIPGVTAIPSAPDITEGNLPGAKWMFRVVPHDGMLASPLIGEFMMKDLKAKAVAMLVTNDDWGRQSTAVLKDVFEKAGGSVTDLEFYTPGETNYLPQLTKIKGTNPDIIFLVGGAQDESMIAKQMKELGLGKPYIGLGALGSPTFVGLAKEAAEGAYGVVQYTDTIDTPENKAFVESWTKRYPNSGIPDKFGWAPYSATKTIFEAIKLAGSSDPAKIRDALEKVKFMGLTGEVSFDSHHQAHPNIYITVIKNGKPIMVKAISTATGQ